MSASQNKIKVVLADDEPAARTSLEILLQREQDMELVARCCNGREAVDAILAWRPELVLLDIQMPEAGGFEVIESVKGQHLPVFVFVTAYDRYAIKAFEHSACDYLLKPYDDERFYQSLQKARTTIGAGKMQTQWQQIEKLLQYLPVAPAAIAPPDYPSRLSIKCNRRIIFQEVADIMFVESEGNFVKLHTVSGIKIASYTFKQLQELLSPQQFVRIHKSYIVNLSWIAFLEPHFHGDYVIGLKGGATLKMSRNYREALSHLLG